MDLSVGFLTDYMKSTSKVSSDWKRQVAIFLWLVDERYNLGTSNTATSKASSSILDWNVKAVQAKKLSNFLLGLITKRISFHWGISRCSFVRTIAKTGQSRSYPQWLNLGCRTVMWSGHVKSQCHRGAYKKGNNYSTDGHIQCIFFNQLFVCVCGEGVKLNK